MRSTALFTAVLALGATSVFAQTPTPVQKRITAFTAQLSLEIAVRGYAGDERARAMAGDSAPDKIESYVWTDKTFCSMGSAPSMPTTTPWVGWHFVGTVQNLTPETGRGAIQFKVEWQRIWENGARVAEGSKGTSSTSLREGERLVLDSANGGGTEGCGATQVRLEVGAITRAPYRIGFFSQGRGGTLGGALAGAGGRGAAANTNPLVTPKTTPLEFQKRLEATRTNRLFVRPGSYDAELWLVHRHPDGTETTQQQTVRFTGTDQAFTFPNVAVPTAKGDISLDISGTLRAVAGDDPNVQSPFGPNFSTGFHSFDFKTWVTGDTAIRLAVSIARRARAGGTPPLDTRGGSYFLMDVPAPADVVSFEFPSLQKATEDLLKGHSFSLRIKVTPVAK